MTLTPAPDYERSYAFDMSRGASAKRLVCVLTYNGVAIGDHASRELAEAVADTMSTRLGTARRCFGVRAEWR
jgi:hypothetical protein